MDSLANYGSDDDYEYDNTRHNSDGAGGGGGGRRRGAPNTVRRAEAGRDDDTNYDDVTMDMSEDSFSEGGSPHRSSPRATQSPEPPEPQPQHLHAPHLPHPPQLRNHRQASPRDTDYSRDNDRYSRKSPVNSGNARSYESSDHYGGGVSKRGLLGDRPSDGIYQPSGKPGLLGERPDSSRDFSSRDYPTRDNPAREYPTRDFPSRDNASRDSGAAKPMALMDLKPFGDDPPPVALSLAQDNRGGSYKGRDKDAVHRYDKEEKRDREGDSRDRRYKDSDRDKDKHAAHHRDRKHYDDKRSSKRDRSRSREKTGGSRKRSSSGDRTGRSHHSRRSNSHERRSKRSSSRDRDRGRDKERSHQPGSDYKPPYKLSKKLQAMEKMGLSIKTPDGSMATAQMLMQRSAAEGGAPGRGGLAAYQLPKYYNPAVVNPLKYAEQIQKRKLLWGNKGKEVAAAPEAGPAPSAANKWQGTKFAQDQDGKVASKFMRLMGVKDPNAVKPPTEEEPTADIVKKQEEMFQVMQAQYEVARATTHTMRGVGLGFSSFNRQY